MDVSAGGADGTSGYMDVNSGGYDDDEEDV